MLEIKVGEKLEVDSLISFHGKINQNELDEIGRNMEKRIQDAGAKKIGNPITAIYSVEGSLMDLELLIPVDKVMEDTEGYKFKEKLNIVNAAKLSYKGHPNGLQNACNELNQYIVNNKLHPITVGYNITRHAELANPDNTEIDVYVGISPNIL